MQVYLLTAGHQSVPGIVTKIFADKRLADREAAELVNVMLADADMPKGATEESWELCLCKLLEELDVDDDSVDAPFCDVVLHEVIRS